MMSRGTIVVGRATQLFTKYPIWGIDGALSADGGSGD